MANGDFENHTQQNSAAIDSQCNQNPNLIANWVTSTGLLNLVTIGLTGQEGFGPVTPDITLYNTSGFPTNTDGPTPCNLNNSTGLNLLAGEDNGTFSFNPLNFGVGQGPNAGFHESIAQFLPQPLIAGKYLHLQIHGHDGKCSEFDGSHCELVNFC